MIISINNTDDIAKMRIAGKLASEVLDYITPFVENGVTTEKLDQLCHDYIVNVQQAIPAPLNYAPDGHTPYPKSVCTSVNHVICHGVPGDKVLKNGDTVNIDITVIKDGYHGDTSRMFHVGEVSIQAKRLSELTYQAMWLGINKVRPDATLGDIGYAIQSFAEKNGFSVVREFCGHGIGKKFHEDPQVLHYGRPNTGVAGEHADKVKTSNPVSVTSTVCSHCADKLRSLVTIVQPSGNCLISRLPALIIGSMVNIMPARSFTPVFGLP